MTIKDLLKEEYKDTFKHKITGEAVEIFVNPSKKELHAEINKNKYKKVRFLATKHNKKLYIWDSEMLHYSVAESGTIEGLDNKLAYDNQPNVAGGIIAFSKNKTIYAYDTFGNLRGKEWHWLSEYAKFTMMK